MTTTHEIHPYCAQYPDLAQDELQALADDIAAHGQHQPIYRYNKQIIDGKNRFAACQLAGVTPIFEAWRPTKPSDPDAVDAEILAFSTSQNDFRRHMTGTQRAMQAAKRVIASGDDLSRTQAAAAADVSRASVNQAVRVLTQGSSALIEAVEAGELSVRDADRVLDLPKAEQTKAVKKVRAGIARTVAAAVGKPRDKKPAAAVASPAAEASEAPAPVEVPDAQRPEGVPSGGTTFAPAEFDAAMTVEDEDAESLKIPKHLQPMADSRKEFAACMTEVGRLRGRIERLSEAAGGGKLAKWRSDIDRCCTQIQIYLKCYRFWAPCPECKITDKNKTPVKDCKLCGGHGWIPETNGLSDFHKIWLRERGVKC